MSVVSEDIAAADTIADLGPVVHATIAVVAPAAAEVGGSRGVSSVMTFGDLYVVCYSPAEAPI